MDNIKDNIKDNNSNNNDNDSKSNGNLNNQEALNLKIPELMFKNASIMPLYTNIGDEEDRTENMIDVNSETKIDIDSNQNIKRESQKEGDDVSNSEKIRKKELLEIEGQEIFGGVETTIEDIEEARREEENILAEEKSKKDKKLKKEKKEKEKNKEKKQRKKQRN